MTHDIMKEFLLKHHDEVFDMYNFEWDEEAYAEAMREDGREEGLEKGLEKGREEGITTGLLASIRNLMDSMSWTAQEAMNMLKIAPAEQKHFAALLNA